MTVHFMVVKGIMLNACSHSVRLHALHIRNDHPRSQVRVFSHILEISSVKRSSVYVHARTEQHTLVPVTCFFPYALSVKGRHLLIPCRSQTGQCRKGDAGIIRPSCLVPFIPQHFRTYAVRSVGSPDFRYSQPRHSCGTEFRLRMQHVDFFLQGHSSQSILDPLFYGFGLVKINRNLRRQRGRCRDKPGNDIQNLHFKTVKLNTTSVTGNNILPASKIKKSSVKSRQNLSCSRFLHTFKFGKFHSRQNLSCSRFLHTFKFGKFHVYRQQYELGNHNRTDIVLCRDCTHDIWNVTSEQDRSKRRQSGHQRKLRTNCQH